MANPKATIKYRKSCTLTVTTADNYLVVFIDPDRLGKGGLSGRLYEHQSIGWAANPGATIDLVPTLSRFGGSANLAFVGANFQGPGRCSFSIKTDKGNWSRNSALGEWKGREWAVRVQKV